MRTQLFNLLRSTKLKEELVKRYAALLEEVFKKDYDELPPLLLENEAFLESKGIEHDHAVGITLAAKAQSQSPGNMRPSRKYSKSSFESSNDERSTKEL
jgi:hypothetical protein